MVIVTGFMQSCMKACKMYILPALPMQCSSSINMSSLGCSSSSHLSVSHHCQKASTLSVMDLHQSAAPRHPQPTSENHGTLSSGKLLLESKHCATQLLASNILDKEVMMWICVHRMLVAYDSDNVAMSVFITVLVGHTLRSYACNSAYSLMREKRGKLDRSQCITCPSSSTTNALAVKALQTFA